MRRKTRWITTWNDYLGDIKFFFRWLHNWKLNDGESRNDSQISDWETPSFAQVKKKKTKPLSAYLESEIWDRDELALVIKYEQFQRNKVALANISLYRKTNVLCPLKGNGDLLDDVKSVLAAKRN